MGPIRKLCSCESHKYDKLACNRNFPHDILHISVWWLNSWWEEIVRERPIYIELLRWPHGWKLCGRSGAEWFEIHVTAEERGCVILSSVWRTHSQKSAYLTLGKANVPMQRTRITSCGVDSDNAHPSVSLRSNFLFTGPGRAWNHQVSTCKSPNPHPTTYPHPSLLLLLLLLPAFWAADPLPSIDGVKQQKEQQMDATQY